MIFNFIRRRDALLKPPVWAKAIPGGWDSKDDGMLLLGVFYHGAPATTEGWQIIAADPALNLKEKLKGLRTNWALRTGQGLSADDNKDELVKVRAAARGKRNIYSLYIVSTLHYVAGLCACLPKCFCKQTNNFAILLCLQASHIISRVNQLMRKIKELSSRDAKVSSKAGGGTSREAAEKRGGTGNKGAADKSGGGGPRGASRPAGAEKASGGGRAASDNSCKGDMMDVRPTLKDMRNLQVRPRNFLAPSLGFRCWLLWFFLIPSFFFCLKVCC